MFKNKSNLLFKIFSIIGITLLLSAILTLIIYIIISNKIYVNSRISELKSMGESIVEIISSNNDVSVGRIKNILDSNMNFADTKIEIYDASGKSYMLNYGIDSRLDNYKKYRFEMRERVKNSIINQDIKNVLEQVLSGSEVVSETRNYLFVGYPVFDNDNNVIAAVILTKPTPFFDYVSNNSLYLTLVLSTLGVFLIMLLPAYLIVRKIVTPLRQMTVVANSMAKGDFSKRADEDAKGEIGELAKAINTCAKESEKLEITRRDYVANVSHELRTPIASMRVIGETLRDGLVKDEEKKKKYYDTIVKESVRLSNLVDDLLELSRIQSGNYVIEKEIFNIYEILDSVTDIYTNVSKDDIRFNVDRPKQDIEIYGNVEKIEQVLIILIDNAFKHTKSGKVEVSIDEFKDKIIVNVCDTGCGISDEDISHIFERFYKVDKSHSSNGSGLGLSIAKEILNVMGEEIFVSSKLGEGSKFSFSIQKKN